MRFASSSGCLLGLLLLAIPQVVQGQASVAVDCLITPSDPSCASYVLPDATIQTDLEGLCSQMPFMPGCSLRKSCQTSGKTDQWCTSFSLLADICSLDMPSMRDCKNYVGLCGSATQPANGTRPLICTKAPMVTDFPTTKNASALVLDICAEMDMAGCERCPKPKPGAYAADCDTLGTYAILCKAMPEMRQCDTWKSMCSATSASAGALSFQESEFCAIGVGSPEMNPPKMRMFFHGGWEDYVLFETWVPRSQGQYVGTWFALFFLTLFYQTIATYRTALDIEWAQELLEKNEAAAAAGSLDLAKSDSSSAGLAEGSTATAVRGGRPRPSIFMSWVRLWRQPWTMNEIRQNLIRSILTFVETTLGYALMLVTMTFNVPLFFAVILGLVVGSVIFSRQRNMVMVQSNGSSAAASSGGSGCAGCG